MCGFCGFAGEEYAAEDIVTAMMDKLAHRGPDSEGTYLGAGITIGFRRLSINGLENGSQPFYNEDSTLVMVLNGEIYNYLELREGLIQKGHTFATKSDAETVLHLYEEHGTGLLSYLRGMFAFALYDIPNKRLFCARDPFGIKPFYYTLGSTGGEFIFGSEIKSFMAHPNFVPEVNEEALAQYLSFQYSVLPETFFKGVYKLMPSHYLVLDSGDVQISRYHSHMFTSTEMDLSTAVDSIDSAVRESIAKHMISEVEIGSFLSGGVDSSYVAACFGGEKTFTVGFDYEDYNEMEYAKSLSESIGAVNISKIITTDEYWSHLPKIQYHMDEPLADPSAVALYFVSREAAKHVKAVLSGEGADELFGGYNIYKEPLSLKFLTSLPMPIRKTLAKLAALLPEGTKGRSFFIRGAKTVEERYIGGANIFNSDQRKILLKNSNWPDPELVTKQHYDKVRHEDDITKMQYLDIHMWMVGDILLKADKMSMAHCLEVRVPFLDKEVFRIASRLPRNLRVTKKSTKYAFRQAAARHVSLSTANRKKLGFPVPIRLWLREEKYYNQVKESFKSPVSEKYFHTEPLMVLLDEHYRGKKDNSRKIWTVFMFLVWHGEYFNDL